MKKRFAHQISADIWRSKDIQFSDNFFSDFYLKPELLKGLEKSGFNKPSEIQSKTIPYGRLGIDLFVESKSGTGKTCVFAVIVLDSINTFSDCCQSLILAPTREIATQIYEVFNLLGRFIKNLKIKLFIGGSNVRKNILSLQSCHIAIGTPGRINFLLENKISFFENVRILVFDEADKFFEDFDPFIKNIFNFFPFDYQTILVTATSNPKIFEFMKTKMYKPLHIKIDYEKIFLDGLDQYYLSFENVFTSVLEKHHLLILIKIFDKITFNQCIIFTNSEYGTEFLKTNLNNHDLSTDFINGKLDQKLRNKIMQDMKSCKIKILICSDLISRGVDLENVDLVINLDVPFNFDTYLHRLGRCGRFGLPGISITFCYGNQNLNRLLSFSNEVKENIKFLENLDDLNDYWIQKKKNKPITLESLMDQECKENKNYFTFNQLIKNYENFKNKI